MTQKKQPLHNPYKKDLNKLEESPEYKRQMRLIRARFYKYVGDIQANNLFLFL